MRIFIENCKRNLIQDFCSVHIKFHLTSVGWKSGKNVTKLQLRRAISVIYLLPAKQQLLSPDSFLVQLKNLVTKLAFDCPFNLLLKLFQRSS